MRKVIVCALVLLGSFYLGGQAAVAEVMLSGSTTVQTRILEPTLADIKAATGVDVRVEGIGSGNGFKRLMRGEVDAAIVSAPMIGLLNSNDIPDDGTYLQHDIMQDLIVPIVNVANPIAELDWEQLAGLYSGAIRNWKDVGGPDMAVRVVTSDPSFATREVVWELVMGKKVDFARNAHIVYATKKEMVLVAERKGAIGAVSQGFVDQYLAEIKTSGDQPEVKAVTPTPRISRPLALITKGPPSPDLVKVIEYLRTDAAQAKFK